MPQSLCTFTKVGFEITMPTRFAILGDGSWGTAVALLLAENPNHEVTLWSARDDNARQLQETRENRRFLPGLLIPSSVRLTADHRVAIDGADLLIAAIPTVYLRTTLERLAPTVC